jgi:hypothetical protein
MTEQTVHRAHRRSQVGHWPERQVQDGRDTAHRQLLVGKAERISTIRLAVMPSP